MTEHEVIQAITDFLPNLDILATAGDYYLYYDPKDGKGLDRRFPFATLVTSDQHDTFSNLAREGVYRLNVGVSKATFQALFPPNEAAPVEGAATTGHDFTALDTIFPHPVYGSMYWLSVLNPSETTFERVKEFLREAYETAEKKYKNKNQ
jgi:hypothetical protein